MALYLYQTPYYAESNAFINDSFCYFAESIYSLRVNVCKRYGRNELAYHINVVRDDDDWYKNAKRAIYNYEIILRDGRWEVLTGDFMLNYGEGDTERYYPVDYSKLTVIKKFKLDEFDKIKEFCVRNSDPTHGKLQWHGEEKLQLTGTGFTGIVNYLIVKNTGGKFRFNAIRKTAQNIIDNDKINLNEFLGESNSVESLKLLCQENYDKFTDKFYNNESFTAQKHKNHELRAPKVNTKEVTEADINWHAGEGANGKNNWHLNYPGANKINYYIHLDADTYYLYKITNMIKQYYRYSSITPQPKVTQLGVAASREDLTRSCLADIASGAKKQIKINNSLQKRVYRFCVNFFNAPPWKSFKKAVNLP